MLASFLQIFFRSFGLSLLIPFLGERQGVINKIIFSILLSFLAFPASIEASDYNFIIYIRETLIGIALGFPIALTLALYGMLAELVDVGRGQNLSNFYDASSKQNGTALVTLTRYFVWLQFLYLGIIENIIKSLQDSFISLPLGAKEFDFAQAGVGLSETTLSVMINLFQIYAPFALLSLSIDSVVGFLGKLMPQVNLFSESFQIKSVLKIFALIKLSEFISYG